MHSFFATTAKGMEEVLAAELRVLGAQSVAAQRAGVGFSGTLEIAYRACLWSRVANRILLLLASCPAETSEALYAGVRSIRWSDHLGPRQTLAVDFVVSQAASTSAEPSVGGSVGGRQRRAGRPRPYDLEEPGSLAVRRGAVSAPRLSGRRSRVPITGGAITHSHYGALKVKDAIVDQLREQSGARPSVAVVQPDVRVNVYVHANQALVSIDLSGDSLHRRAYRQHGVAAPLKENLAAAVLLLADWPRLADAGVPFLDPMCGSGTLPIEAALIAAHIAPGRARTYFGFLGWRGHQPAVWARLRQEAGDAEVRDAKRLPLIHGYDADAGAVRAALANVERAGLRGKVHVEKRALAACEPLPSRVEEAPRGLLVTNPPYGERVGSAAGVPSAGPLPVGSRPAAQSETLPGETLAALYGELGDTLRRKFTGWTGYVLAGNLALAKHIGLRAARRYTLYNGAIECRLLAFPISSQPVRDAQGPHWRAKVES
jgi:23S rRNA (guanine2069-N7)-methyltransferase / 23S rRNA (guanine2445-N2)-methyltransferase